MNEKDYASVSSEHKRKFGDSLPFFGLTGQQMAWMRKEAIKAIAGKRGPVTRAQMEKAFDIEPEEGIDY